MKRSSLAAACLALSVVSCAQQSAPPPSAQPPVAPRPKFFEHTITFSGETLADIALHYTGKATNWTAIRDANPGLKPDRLKIGQLVLIPQELIVNEKPFTKSSLKRVPKPAATPTVAPDATPAPVAEEPKPESAVEPTPTPAPTPVVEATPAPIPAPTQEPTPVPTAPAANPGDQDREKLLDELLK